MPSLSFLSRKNRLRLAIAAIILGAFSFMGWQHFYPVQAASSWAIGVYLDHLPMVSAMAADAQGNLYVSQEFGKKRGSVFRINPDGRTEVIIIGLSKPDGLALFRNGIAVSQETGETPVLWWKNGKVETLLSGNSVEGIASDGDRLFAIEDVKHHGRLLKYDPAERKITVLREGLEESEGIAICPDGALFYTEKKKGWIKRLQPGREDVVVASGLNAPSYLMCNAEGLWITEDATHRARLLLLDTSGKLNTLLSHLRAPQTILAIAPGHYLLAEQGRGRILELHRTAK